MGATVSVSVRDHAHFEACMSPTMRNLSDALQVWHRVHHMSPILTFEAFDEVFGHLPVRSTLASRLMRAAASRGPTLPQHHVN